MPWPAQHFELFVGLLWVALVGGVGLAGAGLLACAWGAWRKRGWMAALGVVLVALGLLSIRVATAQREQVRRVEACRANLFDIGGAVEFYQASTGQFPSDMAALVPEFLPTLPTCPSAGRDTYSATYVPSIDLARFTVECGGDHHVLGGVPLPDLPRYGSLNGLQP